MDTVEIVASPGYLMRWADPEVQESVAKLKSAGEECQAWGGAFFSLIGRLVAEGFPGTIGAMSKAPFDVIGDTLRGTRGVVTDMYRQPDKLLEACDRLVGPCVRWVTRNANPFSPPMVFMPLHKGADSFMSEADYRTFYWPTLKAWKVTGYTTTPLRGRMASSSGIELSSSAASEDGLSSIDSFWTSILSANPSRFACSRSFSRTRDLSSSKASQDKETSSRWGVDSLPLGQAEERQPIADAKGLFQEAREARPVVAKFPVRVRRWQEPAIVGPVDLTHLQLFAPAVDEDGGPVRLAPGAAAAVLSAAPGHFAQASLEEGLVIAKRADDGGEFHDEAVQSLPVDAGVVVGRCHGVHSGGSNTAI